MTIKTKIGYVKGDPGPKIVDIIEKSHIGNAHIFTAVLEDGSHVDFPPLYDSDMTKAEFVNPGGTGEVLKAKMVGEAITSVLEGLTEDADGKLLYKGNPIISDSEDLFTGTVVDYEAAEAAGKLKDGTLVALEDDEEDEPSYVNPDDFDLTNGILSLSMGIKEKIDNSHTKIDQVTERLSDNADWLKSKNLFDVSMCSDVKSDIKIKQIKLKPNTLYTMSCANPTTQGLSEIFIKGGYYTTDVFAAPTDSVGYDTASRTITTDSDGYLSIGYRLRPSLNYESFANRGWQIEEGSTSTPFQPYSDSNVELTAKLSQNEEDGFLRKNRYNPSENNRNYYYNPSNGALTPLEGISCSSKMEISQNEVVYIGGFAQEIRLYKWKANGTYDSSETVTTPYTYQAKESGFFAINYTNATDINKIYIGAKSNSVITEDISWKKLVEV